jgi:hypothetical protein
MTNDTVLWLLLAITIFTAAVGAPLALALREEVERAKAKVANYAAIGIVTWLLKFVALGLWWRYAVQTDQIMLAVIPTVAAVSAWVMTGVMRLMKDA